MEGYCQNSQCILDYLDLFRALSQDQPEAEICRVLWENMIRREAATPEEVRLAPPLLRRQFGLCQRDFLLVMVALALEMDGALRGRFRRRYGLSLPTVEYGLQLIAPICPSTCETLAELAGSGPLCTLLLTAAENSGYPMERPLILCRTALAYLTGFQAADIPGCTLLLEQGQGWLPLYLQALAQVEAWHCRVGASPLYLCGPVGSGRRSLLRRACGPVVVGELEALTTFSRLEQDQALREMGVLARLLDAPMCALPDREGERQKALERMCRKQGVPLAVLVEEDSRLEVAGEVVRLPRQLTAVERGAVWRTFVPQATPDSEPDGAMTVGAVIETAERAEWLAQAAGRDRVAWEDTQQALLQRSGTLGFGVRREQDATLEDMVLPEAVLTQLERLCQTARYSGRLVQWSLPQSREGVTAVFHGPSGTGKTMAASAIANTLGLPLLRADLSQIMDKYVGETEKHLGRLFRCARETRCVLLFDEADALFGKRSDLSSGHDKYANLSTSYLLQEMEEYEGVALLSTNLLSHFDDAFLRRLQYIVRFSLPDGELREKLWRRVLPADRRGEAFPFAVLAQAELSPARICAVARSAAVAAMAAGQEKINTAEVITALRLELEKDGKALPRGLAQRVQEQKGAGRG